jgi:hypothetical protein
MDTNLSEQHAASFFRVELRCDLLIGVVDIGFKVLTPIHIFISVFCVVMPCSFVVDGYSV